MLVFGFMRRFLVARGGFEEFLKDFACFSRKCGIIGITDESFGLSGRRL